MQNISYFKLLILFLLIAKQGHSQGRWEKVKPASGATISDPSGTNADKPYTDSNFNYGSVALPSPRTDAITWADPNGYLWVFGGVGFDEKFDWGTFNDLWRYDVKANTWLLIKGNRQVATNENSLKSDTPLSRADAASWIDKKGNLWLYGGHQLSDLHHLDDMWMFDSQRTVWTRISGQSSFNQKAVRNSLKSNSTTTTPGSRSQAGTWVDKNGTLWLYGGVSYPDTTVGLPSFCNDLWSFDPDNKKWTWVNGADKPNRATQTTDSKDGKKNSSPSPRLGAACWYDETNDQLWLYGGFGYDSTANRTGGLSDLWTYDIKQASWKLMSNPQPLNTESVIHSVNSENEHNTPGFRYTAMSWKDEEGSFLLTGGHTRVSADQIELESAVWKLNPRTNQWRILPLNEPVSTLSAGRAFTSPQGEVYLFGGKELISDLLKTRPTNAIWRLKL